MSYIPNGKHYWPYIYWEAHRWGEVYVCQRCGSRGCHMSLTTTQPCPTCAGDKIKKDTGRWVWTTPKWNWRRFWRFPESSGYWQLKDEYF